MKQILNNRIECLDGFSMSVQASHDHYSTPRVNNADKYSAVECGYPSKEEPLLNCFAERIEGRLPAELIYAFVPTHVVEKIIERHGGVLEGEAPKGVKAVTAKDLWLRHKTELSDCKSFIAMQAKEISHLTKRRAY